LDIEKAFDTTSHAGLLYELLKSELSVKMIKFLSSFVSSRKFRNSEFLLKTRYLRPAKYMLGYHKVPSCPFPCTVCTERHLPNSRGPPSPLYRWHVYIIQPIAKRFVFSENCNAVSL